MLIAFFRKQLRRWLRERALRLPTATVNAIAKRFGVPSELVVEINDAIIEWAERELGL